MQNADTLLRTKLNVPFIRPGLVSRPRLKALMAQGLCGPLTLVTAPAGFGKTTLVASSLDGSAERIAWLSLERDDSQTGRFLAYVVACLQHADEQLGNTASSLLADMQQISPETVLTELINDLDAAQREVVLVLDDYQFISSQAIHQAVAFLVEHCPHNLHLVIASRSDPPLPLARLRARGQLVEIRAAELRFTPSEAAQFLNEVMGLNLAEESVAKLEERTEGWVAGLQMAALSMRDRKDISGFIEGFSGSQRYILDYLLEEVLARQPAEIQEFLLRTSILERLTAGLCDEVTRGQGSGVTGLKDRDQDSGFGIQERTITQRGSTALDYSGLNANRSQGVLEYLEKENLFLVPLDEEHTWYRYHHLFGDLLAAQLLRSHPQDIVELHSRASEWYEVNGWFDQAIEHAFSAGDLDRAARLVESRAQKLVYQISFERIQNWIDRMPEDLVLQRTWIGITQGWIWVAKMQVGGLDSWMDQVEERFLAGGAQGYSTVEQQDIRANIASLRAYAAFFRGDLNRCGSLSTQALNLLSPANPDLRVRILVQLGETNLILMQIDQASTYLTQAIETGISVGDFQSVTTAAMRLYKGLRLSGKLNEAESMLQRVLQALAQAGRASRPVATKPEQCWGDLLRERGQMEEAGVQLEQGLKHARQYRSPLDIITALIYQSAWFRDQADWQGAQKALDEAETWLRSYTIPPVIQATWARQQAYLCMETGEVERAEAYLKDTKGEEADILRAELLLKRGELEAAQSLLERLELAAAEGQRAGNLIQIWLVQASVWQACGDQTKACDSLARCLSLARPQRYLMTFLEKGKPIEKTLQLLRRQDLAQPLAEYVLGLLQAFDERRSSAAAQDGTEARTSIARQEKAPPSGGLIEPLSEREREVLQLLAQGKTNKEIAQQLIVSTGTVKAHTSNIFRKLDVANRTEAVARARQLGILP